MVIRSAFGKSGYHFDNVSDLLSFPSSTSCKMAVATNVLVTLPIRNRSSRSGALPVSRFALPWAVRYSPSPGTDTATKTPGRFLSFIIAAMVVSNPLRLAAEKRSSPPLVCCVGSEGDCCCCSVLPVSPPHPLSTRVAKAVTTSPFVHSRMRFILAPPFTKGGADQPRRVAQRHHRSK